MTSKYETPNEWKWTRAGKSGVWIATHNDWILRVEADWDAYKAHVYRRSDGRDDLIAALENVPHRVWAQRWCEGVARGVEMAPENTPPEPGDENP